jgi:hypothetical protein
MSSALAAAATGSLPRVGAVLAAGALARLAEDVGDVPHRPVAGAIDGVPDCRALGRRCGELAGEADLCGENTRSKPLSFRLCCDQGSPVSAQCASNSRDISALGGGRDLAEIHHDWIAPLPLAERPSPIARASAWMRRAIVSRPWFWATG